MNTSLKRKQTHRYTEQTSGCQAGAGQGRMGSLGLAGANCCI